MSTERHLAALVAAALIAIPSTSTRAQTPVDSGRVDKTFFTRRDLVLSGAALAGTAVVSTFDERIARWTQTTGVQGGSTRHNAFNSLTHFNETPLTIAAVATYGVGRLVHSETVADVGLHWSEAIILNNVISEVIRGPVGRVRPRVFADRTPPGVPVKYDAYSFEFWSGFTKFENRSFPSLHASSAFASAAAIAGEVHARSPDKFWVVAPIAYGVAMIPGITRMYLNQHWASDVVAGAFVGTLIGTKVVHYSHTHKRSKLDRVLLGATAAPLTGGGWMDGYVTRP